MKRLSLPNLIQLKDIAPQAYEDLVKMQQHINDVTKQLGSLSDPQAAGGITVTATNGIIDVVIFDKHPQVGEEYFLEYDTQPSFATAHTEHLGPSRNYRNGNLNGQTTYWRWYKDTKLGGAPSNRITFGSPPTAVIAGNLSTTTAGPVPGAAQGSGQSQIPGYGYGRTLGSRELEVL